MLVSVAVRNFHYSDTVILLHSKMKIFLSGLREAIEKQAAAMEAERSCLSAMNRDLESRMLRHQQEVNDDKSRFEAREKMWEKERLKAVEILDREKKDLEVSTSHISH